jgi:rubrerythrin
VFGGAPNVTAHDRPTGLSVWEEELYDRLMDHVAAESSVLARYDSLAETSTGHVQFLLELIAEDEARHHRLFERWAETIRDIGQLVESEDGLPSLVHEPDPKALIAAADELLELERRDARELKALDKMLKDVRRTTVWPLLVDLMVLDTEKHIRILEFLRHHAQRTARGDT